MRAVEKKIFACEFARFLVVCEWSYDGETDTFEIDSNPHGFKNGKYKTAQLYELFYKIKIKP